MDIDQCKMQIAALKTQWCLIGNVGGARSSHDVSPSSGTVHYSSGTKVYCLPAQWGDGYEKIVAIGKHRSSKAVSCLVMPSKFISNWRAQVVYSPAVLGAIREWCSVQGHSNWQSTTEV